MPVQFYEKNQGFGDLARALVSAPALYGQARRYGQQQAYDRAKDAAGIQESIAEARKTNIEAEQLADQRRYQAGLPGDLDVLDARRSGRLITQPPPAPGSARNPLEGDVNASIRSNPDLFVSAEAPSATDASSALANLLRAFPGNAEQMTGAMGNVQSQDLSAEAAGAARENLLGRELIATLNSIAAGNQVQAPYSQTSAGSVLNEFTGQVDQSNPMAQASIGAERALETQRLTDEATKTPQDKQYDALVNLNQAYSDAGLPTMDEVTMREIASGHMQTFNDPRGLTRLIYDPARRQIVGTVDEKNGFQAFQPDAPAPTGDGQSWSEWLSSWWPGGGDPGAVQAEPGPAQPGAGMYSPVLQRQVTEAEIAQTAQNRGLTPDEVRQRLGIQ